MSLDLTRLEKVRHSGNKTIARCPACAEGGSDRTGNHLVIFPSGKFACAAHPDDAEHRKQIFTLAGLPERRTPFIPDAGWQARREQERRGEEARATLNLSARQRRGKIIARYPWLPADVWDDSPQRIDGELVEHDPRHFLASLFPPEAFLWTGEPHHSGQEGKHAHHWQPRRTWEQALPATIGPMTTPAIWQDGSVSRSAENVHSTPYTVLDFDGFDGIQPQTPEELRQHVHDSLSLIRWLREHQRWSLAAILWTGSKSLHAWFHTPSDAVVASLKTIATTLGMDAGLIGHPEHPCRLPGQTHQKTGKTSRVLWLEARRF